MNTDTPHGDPHQPQPPPTPADTPNREPPLLQPPRETASPDPARSNDEPPPPRPHHPPCHTPCHQTPPPPNPGPSTTPQQYSSTISWERKMWVNRVTSLSNLRDHVPGDIPSPDNQHPAPSRDITLMHNRHYTLSTSHYLAPTDTCVVLPPRRLQPPARTGHAPARTPGRTSRTSSTSGARGSASPWTRCYPSAAAIRGLGREMYCLAKWTQRSWEIPAERWTGWSPPVPSRRRPPETARDPPPRAPSQSSPLL